MEKSKNQPLSNYAWNQTKFIENNRANRAAINKIFRAHDESHLYPVRGRFDATERAIRRAQRFNRETGNDMAGLEYCLFLESEISNIVNEEI